MKGTAILVLPTGLLAAVLAWHLAGIPIDQSGAAPRRRGGSPGATHDAWGSFARLTAVVVGRSVLFYGFNTFLPLYWIHVLGQSKAAGATALTVFALASVCGNLLGGRLADRFGSTRIVALGFCGLLPLVPALTMASSAPVALAILVLIGCALSTTYSPLIILGQAYLPNHIGLSSGVTLGVAVSIGGVATPLLGRVADQHGLWAALAVLSAVPLVSAVLALTLPRPALHSSTPA
jgi:FSR family fosmidomycin resistance protein-like MFS transporter